MYTLRDASGTAQTIPPGFLQWIPGKFRKQRPSRPRKSCQPTCHDAALDALLTYAERPGRHHGQRPTGSALLTYAKRPGRHHGQRPTGSTLLTYAERPGPGWLNRKSHHGLPYDLPHGLPYGFPHGLPYGFLHGYPHGLPHGFLHGYPHGFPWWPALWPDKKKAPRISAEPSSRGQNHKK